MAHLEHELERFLTFYNTVRPRRALGRKTPQFAYYFIPKAASTTDRGRGLWHVRYDIVDASGSITLHYGGKLKHLGIGRSHARLDRDHSRLPPPRCPPPRTAAEQANAFLSIDARPQNSGRQQRRSERAL